jgi:hypothetical protein
MVKEIRLHILQGEGALQYSQDLMTYFLLKRKPSEINILNEQKQTPSPTITYQQPYHNNIAFSPSSYNHTIKTEKNVKRYFQFETFEFQQEETQFNMHVI